MSEPRYTLEFLDWMPWAPRAIDAPVSPQRQAEILTFVDGKNASDYLLVLANDFHSLQARAGTSACLRDRETNTKRIPGARRYYDVTHQRLYFFASVHARHVANFLKDRSLTQRFLDERLDAELPEIWRALVDACAKLTLDPESLTSAELQTLRNSGMTDIEIPDILNYAAFFANANRLMLTLGEPAPQKRLRSFPVTSTGRDIERRAACTRHAAFSATHDAGGATEHGPQGDQIAAAYRSATHRERIAFFIR
jgi:uncharacterized peroxidase-related enzyme